MKAKTDANGNTTEYAYNEMWKIREIRYPNGGIQRFSYNKKGLLETEIDALGNQTHYTYDAVGNLIKEEKEGIGVSSYSYDELDRLVSYTNMDGHTNTYTYDEEGNLTALINPKGTRTEYVYDEVGQLIQETNGAGYTLYYTYSPLGQLESIRDEEAELLHREFEPGGRLKFMERIDGLPTTYEYEANGNLKKVHTLADENIIYHYDNRGRVLSVEGIDGKQETYTYDERGFLCTVRSGKNQGDSYAYDGNGNLTKLTDAMGNETIYRYDAMNRLIEIDRYAGKEEKDKIPLRLCYERDLLGNVLCVTDEAGRKERYTYDAAGRMLTKIDRESNLTSYRYSCEGRLLQISYADGKESSFSYESNGALREVQDWTGKTVMENDTLGRVLQLHYPNGEKIGYRYNLRGERTGICYPDGTWCEYTYDEKGRLAEMKEGGDSIHYGYDFYGRLSKKTLPGEIETEYGYTKDGWLKSIITRGKKDMLYENHRYLYDGERNRTEIIRKRPDAAEASGKYGYVYDALGRLEEVSRDGERIRSYTYDAWGNRLNKKDTMEGKTKEIHYQYHPSGELLRESDGTSELSYTYDLRGNLTEIHRDGVLEKSYCYDCRNRLSQVTTADGRAVTYLYNSLGYRVRREEQQPDGSVTCKNYTVDYTRKANNLLEESDGTTTVRYLWDGRAAVRKEGKESLYYLHDELGSPIRLLNNQGEMLETYAYTEFGEELYDMGATQPFTYTGYQKDELAGTYFAQAREYNPALGRFMAEDIIRGTVLYPQSLNHYAYCYNNPEGFVDEDGEWATVAIGAAIGAAWEAGSTIIESKVKGEDVDWKEVAVNAAKGAVKGAVAGSGAGLLAEAATDGIVDGVGDVAKQMIVDGKSWKEVDKGKAIREGAFSATSSLAIGGISKSKFVKGNEVKEKLLSPLGKETDEALKKAKTLKTEKELLKKLIERNGENDIGKQALDKIVSKRKEYLSGLKKFAYYDFQKEEVGTYKDWLKGTIKDAMVCRLK